MYPAQNLGRSRQGGFSLIELLVGVVISLLMVLVIAQVTVAFEGNKRTSTSGSDAQINGTAALFYLEREIRMAGYGLVARGNMVCEAGVRMGYQGKRVLNNALLAPIRIISGGDSPDALEIVRADARLGALPTLLIGGTAGDSIFVQSPVGLKPKDLFVMGGANGGKVCTIRQLSEEPTLKPASNEWSIKHAAVSDELTPYNMAITPAFDPPTVTYEKGDMISSIGRLSFQRYGLEYGTGSDKKTCNALTVYSPLNATTAPTTCTDTNVTQLIDDVVYFKAHYGVADVGKQTVSEWVAPTDTWAANALTAPLIRRIKAVRIAVVTRSQQLEREVVTASCATAANGDTPASGNITLWPGGPVMKLRGDQCKYRYRVFETMVPVKNVVWGAV